MSTMTLTNAPRISDDMRVEHIVLPATTLRPWGDVCPKQAVLGGVDSPSAFVPAGVVVTDGAIDERGFGRTRAWSPPGS